MRLLFAVVLIPLLFVQGTPPATPSAPIHEECIEAPAELLEWVSMGILPESTAEIPSAWMVKSDDFENVWFLAADLAGDGFDATDDVALWATSAPSEDGTYAMGDGGMVLVANDLAATNTDWLPIADYDVTTDDHGADLAFECAGGEWEG